MKTARKKLNNKQKIISLGIVALLATNFTACNLTTIQASIAGAAIGGGGTYAYTTHTKDNNQTEEEKKKQREKIAAGSLLGGLLGGLIGNSLSNNQTQYEGQAENSTSQIETSKNNQERLLNQNNELRTKSREISSEIDNLKRENLGSRVE